MNVHARFHAVAAVAVFCLGAAQLAAQSATQADVREAPPAAAAIGVVPTSLLDSVTAVAAQPATVASTAPTTETPRGPSLASARVASHPLSTARTTRAAPLIQNRSSNRNSVALMIVGGAALVVGAVIGDDAGTLVMLGGAAIGLYGLYLFLT
jgi:hypothetical protein